MRLWFSIGDVKKASDNELWEKYADLCDIVIEDAQEMKNIAENRDINATSVRHLSEADILTSDVHSALIDIEEIRLELERRRAKDAAVQTEQERGKDNDLV